MLFPGHTLFAKDSPRAELSTVWRGHRCICRAQPVALSTPRRHTARDPTGEVELQVSRCPKAAPLGTLRHGGMLRGSHSCVYLEGSGRGGVVTQRLDGSFSNSNSAETENVSIKRVLSWTPHRNHSRPFDIWDRLRTHTNCKPRKLLGDRGRPKPSRLLPPSPTSGCSAQRSKLCSKWTALNLFFVFFQFSQIFWRCEHSNRLALPAAFCQTLGGGLHTPRCSHTAFSHQILGIQSTNFSF